jgi:hypothetical protein
MQEGLLMLAGLVVMLIGYENLRRSAKPPSDRPKIHVSPLGIAPSLSPGLMRLAGAFFMVVGGAVVLSVLWRLAS